eukprot:Skav205366  [mRNA]  locus=scaffold3980:141535:142077:+ [translate_table: standard]
MDMQPYVVAESVLSQSRLPSRHVQRLKDDRLGLCLKSWSRSSSFSSFSSLSSSKFGGLQRTSLLLPLAALVAKSARRKVCTKVCMKSIRDAREAIRQCLRENRTMPVLQALPEDSLQQILDKMTRMELKPGEHIFRQGEPVDAVYVVEAGELSVMKPLRQGDEDLGRGLAGSFTDKLEMR